jgi:hypothetical protein
MSNPIRKGLNMNKILKIFKGTLESKIDEARMSLILQDGVQATFFTSKDGIVFDSLPLTLSKEMKQIESMQMKTICSDSSIAVAGILMECDTVTVDTEDVDTVEDPKDHPDNMEAILLILYSREDLACSVRVVPYKRKGDHDYWFADKGWEDNIPSTEGLFENVFKSTTHD